MLYSIKRVSQRLKKNILIYFILILEIIIGITFITYSLNHFYSATQRQKVLEQTLTDKTMGIRVYNKEDQIDSTEMALSYEDYKYIEKTFNKPANYYIVKNDIGVTDNEVVDIKIVYTNINRQKTDDNIAWYGSKLKNSLIDNKLENCESVNIKGKYLIDMTNNKEYKLEKLPNKHENFMLPTLLLESDMSLNNCIVLPLSGYEKFSHEDLANSMLYIDLKDIDNSEKLLNDMLTYLREKHGKYYVYEIYNPLEYYKKISKSINELSRYLGRMAVIVLSILLIGFTGIMKIFMKKREKELAINMALGAPKKLLILELFLEVFFICILGTVIGILCGNFLTLNANIDVFNIKIYGKSIVICLFSGIIISLTVVSSSIKKIINMKPVELLKSL